VFSIYDMLFNGMMVLGAVLSAALLPPNGKSYLALVVITGGYLLGALVYRLVVSTFAPRRSSAATPNDPAAEGPAAL
jgi:hypothetical protein